MVQLDELLGNKNLIKLLKFFLRNPSVKISQTDLRRKIKIAKATVIKWSDFLLKEDLLKVDRVGVTKLLQLNKEHLINKQLKILDNLIALRPVVEIGKKYDIKLYLYGSAARGEDNEESDVDLLVIGKIRKEQLFGDINKVSRSIERNIKISIFTQLDWSQMARKDPAFYERIEKDRKELV